MGGGLDILIVGIAGENLDHITSDEKLIALFDERKDDEASADQYVRDFYALVEDPTITNPRIFYLVGEHLCGSQVGAGLGYVIFGGNYNAPPKRLDERVFGRTGKLKQRFIDELKAKGLEVPSDQVGVYALNVYDT